MSTFVRVAEAASLSPGNAMVVQVEGLNIALFNVVGIFYAIDDICSHEGGSLGEGALAGEVVTCPWHNSQFNVKTGEVLGPPGGGALSFHLPGISTRMGNTRPGDLGSGRTASLSQYFPIRFRL